LGLKRIATLTKRLSVEAEALRFLFEDEAHKGMGEAMIAGEIFGAH